MTTSKKAKFSNAAVAAFRQMVFHKVSMWDAALKLEKALGRDVSTEEPLSWVAGAMDDPEAISKMTKADLVEWLENYLTRDHCS